MSLFNSSLPLTLLPDTVSDSLAQAPDLALTPQQARAWFLKYALKQGLSQASASYPVEKAPQTVFKNYILSAEPVALPSQV